MLTYRNSALAFKNIFVKAIAGFSKVDTQMVTTVALLELQSTDLNVNLTTTSWTNTRKEHYGVNHNILASGKYLLNLSIAL